MVRELGQPDSMRGMIGAVRFGQIGPIDRIRIKHGDNGDNSCALSYALPATLTR